MGSGIDEADAKEPTYCGTLSAAIAGKRVDRIPGCSQKRRILYYLIKRLCFSKNLSYIPQ